MKKSAIRIIAIAALVAVLHAPSQARADNPINPDPCLVIECLGGLVAGGMPQGGVPTCMPATQQFFNIWGSKARFTISDRTNYLNQCPGAAQIQPVINSIIAAYGNSVMPQF